MICLKNPLSRLMVVTEIKVAGVSVLADVRSALLTTGRLEDPEDDLTLLPGEALTVNVGPDETPTLYELAWTEQPPDL